MNITVHVKERFVERTMGYTDKQEIARYITLNEDKIIERLNKLFESAEKVFRGKLKDFDSTDVYINKNGWVLIVDHKKDTLVTLYRVDLKVDDEDLNRVFCEKMINKIHTYKKEYEEASLKGMEQQEANNAEIKSINEQLRAYNAMVSALEEKKKGLLEQNKTFQKEMAAAENIMKITIEDFICKRSF